MQLLMKYCIPQSPSLLLSLLLLLSFTCWEQAAAAPIRLHGLNYNTRKGPDWDWDKCKTDTEVLVDLTLLSRITNRIRLLSMVDCGQTAQVLRIAKPLGFQFWIGLWVGPDAQVFEQEKDELVRLIDAGMIEEGTILGISVGSEAIYREDATVDEMIAHMNDVKSLLQAAGLSIPLTICDVAPAFAASPELRAAVEVTMTNTFPFWEGIAIENAVADLQEDLGWLLMQAESQGKPFVLGETGWPSAGFIEGVGIASPSSQARYFAEGFCRVDVENQWDYYWFTGIDNAWRREQDPENTIEGNWGFMYANRTLKSHFEDFSFQCSNGVTYSFSEVDWSIPDMTAPPTPLNPASCAAHSACDGLLGNCCPGDNGLVLLCCDQDISPTANAPSISPVLSSNATNVTTAPAPSNSSRAPQTTTFPTKSPSASPTLAPSEITNAQTASPSSSDPTTLPTPSPSIPVPTQDDSTPEPTPWFTNSTFEPSGNYTTNSTFEPSSSPPLRSPTPRPSVDVVFRPSGGNTADSLVSSGPLRNAGLLALACVITVLATTGRLF